MKNKIYIAIRILLGSGMLFFGGNNLLHFLPSHNFNGIADQVMNAFESSGYILLTVGVVQILFGISLITKRFVPLALLLFAPILINIFFFHLFLDLKGIIQVLPVAGMSTFLFLYHKKEFIHFLKPQNNERF